MAFLTDGFATWIAFPAFTGSVGVFKEKEVQPPDLDGGGEVDTTTMRNIRWRTKQPKKLITLGDCTIQAQYDPICYVTIVSQLLNRNGQVQVLFPDGHKLTFYGWLDKFTPASLKEGEFPLAEIKIHCSNQNNAGDEIAPLYT